MIGTLAGTHPPPRHLRRAAVRRAAGQHQPRPGRPRAGDLADRPGQHRTSSRSTTRQRGPILVGNTPGRPVGADRRPAEVPARVRRRPAVRAGHRLLLARLRRHRRSSGPRTRCSPGTDARLLVQQLADLIAGRTTQGRQRPADPRTRRRRPRRRRRWAGKVGAVVALEPSHRRDPGAVSQPDFDPNLIASHDAATRSRRGTTYLADPRTRCSTARSRRSYPPGSTFKLVTLSAALSSGKYTPVDDRARPRRLKPAQHHGASSTTRAASLCVGQRPHDAARARWQSRATPPSRTSACNVGADALQAQAETFGFNHSFQVPLTAATSVFPPDLNAPQTAQSAIGQYDVRSTALQMAMVAAALANNGVVMNPYLVDTPYAPDPSVLAQTRADRVRPGRHLRGRPGAHRHDGRRRRERHRQPTRRSRASRWPARPAPRRPATTSPPHAWFVAFAPADEPKVAVAVIVEDAPNDGEISGGLLAAPIAKAVMEAVLRQ